MKKKAILGIILIVVIAAVMALFGPSLFNKITGNNVLTSSQLEKAVNISQLSTAEFVYNGVAEKVNDEDPNEVEYYIAYNSNVKVGIQMEDIKFEIDNNNKIVKPILPEIMVNTVTLDEESISYIPKNPDMELKDIIALCKEDAANEANGSQKLYETAEENLKAAIEALLSPILSSEGYSIVW